MALHRDIYWIGRQWAVTGSGLQALDQRLEGAFDIEPARVWDEGLADRMHRQPWFNSEDFEKALSTARQRFPDSRRTSPSLIESVLELIKQPTDASPERLDPAEADNQLSTPAGSVPRSRAAIPTMLQASGQLARFAPQWRIKS